MMKKSNKNEENKKMYNILTKTIRKEIDGKVKLQLNRITAQSF
jgi:hypothetical protein